MIARPLSFLITFFSLVVLSVPALAGPVRGRVIDPDDRPLRGARVTANGGAQLAQSSLTDDRGEFTLLLPDIGTFELRVAADGFRIDPVVLNATADRRDLGDLKMAVSAVSEAIVVSAAQVEVPLTRVSSTVTVLTGEELQLKQLYSIADALRGVPGLSVSATGGPGAVTGVFPRGGESNYTLVFVDDVPVNAFGGDYDFGHLSTANVERIEIVRGPQSALFGSNAIGSVVRIVTRRGGPPAVRGSVEGGGYDTWRVSGTTTGTHGAFDWGASVDRFDTNNYNGHVTAAGLTVTNNDYSRTGGTFVGGWRGARSRVTGQFSQAIDERGSPGPFGTNPIGAFGGIDEESRTDNSRTLAAASWSFSPDGRLRVIAQTAYNRLSSDFASPFGPSESHSNRWLGRGQIDFALTAPLEISAGIELQRERTGSTFITAGSDQQPVEVKRHTGGYFAEARWTATTDVFITGGLRVDHIHRARLEENPDMFSPRPVLDADTVVSINPRAAVAWFVRPGSHNFTKLRAAAATGIRPPDGFELAFTDNPELKPERSVSLEGGVEHAFADGRLQADAVTFFNSYDDLIVAVGSFQQSSRYQTDNISNARARGIELSLTGRNRVGSTGATSIYARVSYTFLDTEVLAVDRTDEAPPPFTVGDPLLRRPRHQFAVDAGVTKGQLSAFLYAGGRSRALDVEPSLGTFGGLFYTPGFNVWNAGGSWRVNRLLDVIGRVENLFDREYEEALGFPALGRRFTIGLRVAASR